MLVVAVVAGELVATPVLVVGIEVGVVAVRSFTAAIGLEPGDALLSVLPALLAAAVVALVEATARAFAIDAFAAAAGGQVALVVAAFIGPVLAVGAALAVARSALALRGGLSL